MLFFLTLTNGNQSFPLISVADEWRCDELSVHVQMSTAPIWDSVTSRRISSVEMIYVILSLCLSVSFVLVCSKPVLLDLNLILKYHIEEKKSDQSPKFSFSELYRGNCDNECLIVPKSKREG
jgi:hypothetical protein